MFTDFPLDLFGSQNCRFANAQIRTSREKKNQNKAKVSDVCLFQSGKIVHFLPKSSDLIDTDVYVLRSS